jgi:hypothetical protein
MSIVVTTVKGTEKKLTLSGQQRVVIETLHGLIEITANMVRSRPNSVSLNLVLPVDMRLRKGPSDELDLAGRWLETEDDVLRPKYPLVSVNLAADGEVNVRGLDKLRVAHVEATAKSA